LDERGFAQDMPRTHGYSGCNQRTWLFVEYLPPYSPDLNPIEKKWSQAKSVRERDRCDVDTLFATAF